MTEDTENSSALSTAGAPGDRTRRPRSDARRNRSHILDVAEQYFTEHGVGGSLDAIAKRAGIGPGTLYRHFPTREALLAALLTARDDALVAELQDIRSTGSSSTVALDRWLDALARWATAFEGLPEPLRVALTEDASPLALTCQGYVTTTDELLAAAQHDGGARAEVRGRDLVLGVLAASWVRGAALADSSASSGVGNLLRTGWKTHR